MSQSLANFVHELHFSSTARRPSLPKCPNSPHFRPRACDVAEFWVVTPSFSTSKSVKGLGRDILLLLFTRTRRPRQCRDSLRLQLTRVVSAGSSVPQTSRNARSWCPRHFLRPSLVHASKFPLFLPWRFYPFLCGGGRPPPAGGRVWPPMAPRKAGPGFPAEPQASCRPSASWQGRGGYDSSSSQFSRPLPSSAWPTTMTPCQTPPAPCGGNQTEPQTMTLPASTGLASPMFNMSPTATTCATRS